MVDWGLAQFRTKISAASVGLDKNIIRIYEVFADLYKEANNIQ